MGTLRAGIVVTAALLLALGCSSSPPPSVTDSKSMADVGNYSTELQRWGQQVPSLAAAQQAEAARLTDVMIDPAEVDPTLSASCFPQGVFSASQAHAAVDRSATDVPVAAVAATSVCRWRSTPDGDVGMTVSGLIYRSPDETLRAMRALADSDTAPSFSSGAVTDVIRREPPRVGWLNVPGATLAQSITADSAFRAVAYMPFGRVLIRVDSHFPKPSTALAARWSADLLSRQQKAIRSFTPTPIAQLAALRRHQTALMAVAIAYEAGSTGRQPSYMWKNYTWRGATHWLDPGAAWAGAFQRARVVDVAMDGSTVARTADAEHARTLAAELLTTIWQGTQPMSLPDGSHDAQCRTVPPPETDGRGPLLSLIHI